MILLACFIALAVFFFINRSLATRRETRRDQLEERRERFYEQLRQMKQKQHKEPDDEGSDTTGAQ